MAQILLTGATGFVGDALLPALVDDGHSLVCLTRNPTKAVKRFTTLSASIRWITSVTEVEMMPNAVINLSGEGIADSRWTDTRKRVLRASRIAVTEQLVAQLNALDGEPDVVVSGSAVGYYGPQTDAMTEEQAPGLDFSARLCADWEKAICGLNVDATHIYTLRIGVVLGRPGGFLGRLETPFRFGLGGPLGNGQQMLSWIHRDDLVAMIRWMLSGSPETGAYNATSPQPVSNGEFTKTFGDILRRPTIFRIPETPMRLALGELADLLFKGQPVYPNRALQQGFQFEYPDLKRALTQLFG